MNNFGKYFLGFIGLVFVGLFCWYFSSIIAYVLIAAVISFLGRPIIDLLGKVKIRGKELHNGIKAALALLALWTLFIFFMVTIIPLVTHEFQNIGNISVDNVMSKLESPVDDISRVLKRYGLIEMDDDMEKSISNSLSSLVSVTRIKTIFGSLANTISDIFVALFSITFISFFFLKDSRLFSGMVLALLPAKYEEGGRNALDSIQKLLVRYFVGILFEVLGVMTLNTLGLWMVGLSFSNALVIGLVSGVLNVIPYIGPIIGVVFGVVVGIVLHIDLPFYTDLLPLLVYMVIAMLITQLIDNVVFQPFIYGNSVHAHPLEIFLVILLAGNLAGIPGMILAIPSYTVLRVILREFFNKYRLVKKITQSLDE
ncbi:AI-2E family transporter [Odoribacter laneus]|jgi:FAD synthase|uniref:AI-2E family transporter n=3 Tax=Odoribacter laneus TaxID=626933 RepID=H1DJY0_9BACT|nr:AI-2E family transporter [Odoribacter laneus]MBS1446302.1 AI-2E family transporter [Odoribacter sp.]EHP45980.1 hypothetical protein HMPREF9449_02566 [Odoribacter laneus YIT 12061]CCZ82331.1 putative uncharacterized protein [Odoribacter laneus CAG:561]GKI23084.1 AI-2E family transporter [Odoribacter laneus]GKI26670.1 AI-2E family transporter [Odoribacter laneus]